MVENDRYSTEKIHADKCDIYVPGTVISMLYATLKNTYSIAIMNLKGLLIVLILGSINILTLYSQVVTYDTAILDKKIIRITKKIENQKYLMTERKINKRIINLTNQLSKVASDGELIYLTDSQNRIMSCIAFWILVKRDNKTIPDIYNKNKDYVKIDSITYIVNNLNKSTIKTCVPVPYSDVNFYEDVYIGKKYLDLIEK